MFIIYKYKSDRHVRQNLFSIFPIRVVHQNSREITLYPSTPYLHEIRASIYDVGENGPLKCRPYD